MTYDLGIIKRQRYNPIGSTATVTGAITTSFNQNGVNYTAHIFTTTGTLLISTGVIAEYLIVAGGGAGGGAGTDGAAGGGGGGGLTTGTIGLVPNVSYTIAVGRGGVGRSDNTGTVAGNSSISGSGISIVALGGGWGSAKGLFAGAGGSGGGGHQVQSTGGAAGVGTFSSGGGPNTATNYVNAGGASAGNVSAYGSGGGGGAGAAGQVGTTTYGGVGGIGTFTTIINTATAISLGIGHYVTATTYVAIFNGSSQYLTVPASTTFNYDTGDFTWECWINPIAGNVQLLIDFWVTVSPLTIGQCQLYLDSTLVLIFSWATGSSTFDSITSASALTSNVWSHVALVRSGSGTGNLKIYINGNLTVTSAGAITQTLGVSSLPGSIGRQTVNNSFYYKGYISNIRLVKGVAVYTGNFTVPTGPLTSTSTSNPFGGVNTNAITATTSTSLLTLQDSTIIDNSSYALSITNIGSVSILGLLTTFGTPSNTIYFAGGGGGSSFTARMGVGGLGGGGGAVNATGAGALGSTGTQYTGGGGGGAYAGGATAFGGNGGSGVVIIRYPSFSTASILSTVSSQALVLQPDSNFKYNSLLLSNLSPPTYLGYAVDYLIVAGGGAGGGGTPGGQPGQGGGGAGGFLTSNSYPVVSGHQYIITVGAGATGGTGVGPTGSTSSFDTILAYGGGGGSGAFPAYDGTNGGSGGGAAGFPGGTSVGGKGVYPGSTYISAARQGYDGGNSRSGTGPYPSGGGGGAGGAGGNASGSTSGSGGIGNTSTIITTAQATSWGIGEGSGGSVYFSGGGGGSPNASSSLSPVAGQGGLGGGAPGIALSSGSANGFSATAFTGGGGGGAVYAFGQNRVGGNGGSGVVVVRYSGTNILATGGNTSTSGGYVYHLFTSSGVITFTGTGTNQVLDNLTFLDSSYNYNSVSVNGNPAQGTFSPYGQNWSTYFNSNLDSLQIPTSTGTSLDLTSSTFTIEAWINVKTLSSQSYIAGVSNSVATSNTSTFDWSFFVTTGTGAISYQSAKGSSSLIVTGGTITTSTWNHVAVSRVGSSATVFVNGIGTTGAVNTITNTNTNIFSIGQLGSFNRRLFNGYISNFRVVKGVTVYATNTNFTPPTSPLPLVTNTVLLACSSNRFIDVSGTTSSFITSGTVSVSKYTPFSPLGTYNKSYTGASVYLDGTSQYINISHNGNIDLSTGQPNFTIECWFYKFNLVSISTLYGKGGTIGTNNQSYSANIETDGKISWYLADSITNTYRYVGQTISTPIVANTWNHFALVRNGNIATAFLNGVASAPISIVYDMVDDGGSLTIGALFDPTFRQGFNGFITNFRIVKGVAIYTSTFTPPSTPLLTIDTSTSTSLLLKFDNASIIDYSGNSNIIAMSSSTISNSQTKFNAYNMYFNGTSNLQILSGSNTSLNLSTGDFTIEAWIYSTSLQVDNACIISNGSASGISFGFTGSGLSLGWGVGGISDYSFAHGMSLNTWYHVALTRNSTNMRMFVNGTQIGVTQSISKAYDLSGISGTNSTIGSYSSSGYFFVGYIDDLRVTRGIARYTTNFGPLANRLQVR